jgi:O-methyltransferase
MAKQQWAYLLFPFYSRTVDRLMSNALLGAWIYKNRSTPVLADRESLHILACAMNAFKPIDYLEFGVWKGESIRMWTRLNQNPDSRFVGFDSFEGLPEDWTGELAKGAFDLGGVPPDIQDHRVQLVKGLFQDTLPAFLKDFSPRDESPLVIHIDADLYSSALYILTKMDDFIRPGTIVIFDDFSSATHEFRAFKDYCQSYRRKLKPVGMTVDFATRAAFVVEV